MKLLQRIFAVLAAVLAIGMGALSASAEVPYQSYNYNIWGESVPVPPAYAPDFLIDAERLGVEAFGRIEDIYVDGRDNLYLLDAGKGEILVTDGTLKSVRRIANPGLAGASGISVSASGTIYAALKDAGKVLVLDASGRLIREIGKPEGKGVPENLSYKPVRVASYNDNTVYIACEGVYQGILEVDRSGKFMGFFGSNQVDVTLSVLTETAWKRLLSQAQRDSMKKIVPIEYSSITMDGDGFIYAVTPQSQNSMYEVKKLNPKGNNILRVRSAADVPAGVRLNLGDYGDIETSYEGGKTIDTKLMDVCVDRHGFISVLDVMRGRVFQYDQESNLISVFGGLSDQKGTFKEPKAVEYWGERLLVLDSFNNEIHAFAPTEFCRSVREATILFNKGLYTQSESLWREVTRQSTNFELAYIGIGKALFSKQDFSGAMKYFRLGYDKRGYDEAYTEYRKEFLRANFIWVVLGALAVVAVLYGAALARRKYRPLAGLTGKGNYLPVSYYVARPFKAADDIRLENRGNMLHAFAIVFLLFCTRILNIGLSGFLFNDIRLETISVSREFFSVFGLYLVFILCNWAVCTLTDGEGRWRDIAVVAAYSLIPVVLSNLACLVLSNLLTLREGALLSIFSSLAVVYAAVLLFAGITTIHRYTAAKSAGTLILTVIGMLLVLFLCSLVYGLFNQFLVFIGNLFTEIMFRI